MTDVVDHPSATTNSASFVLWSAQAMSVQQIAEINDDGFDSLDAKYNGGRRRRRTGSLSSTPSPTARRFLGLTIRR